MIIKKLLHSCILIEHEGQRLLIDPGEFSFIEGKLMPEDIPSVDVILITHEHIDHCSVGAMKKILAKKREPRQGTKPLIYANNHVHDLLQAEGIDSRVIEEEGAEKEMAEKEIVCGAFSIKPLHLPHGALPVAVPHNMGYLINNAVLHPGDSLQLSGITCKVLLLPIAGPWCTLKEALDAALMVRPEAVIPIHDAIVKDFMLERIYKTCEKVLREAGIRFAALSFGNMLEA